MPGIGAISMLAPPAAPGYAPPDPLLPIDVAVGSVPHDPHEEHAAARPGAAIASARPRVGPAESMPCGRASRLEGRVQPGFGRAPRAVVERAVGGRSSGPEPFPRDAPGHLRGRLGAGLPAFTCVQPLTAPIVMPWMK